MILAGANAGNPWHGLWSPAGLLLPNSDLMEVSPVPVGGGISEFSTVMADRGALYPPEHGDCILVRVPGLPAPETSTAEAAAGMTWRNYALLGGARRILHGVELGMHRWIYVDADGKPWLAELRFPATSGQPRVVRFREFGVFRAAPASSYYDYTFGGAMTLDLGAWFYEGTQVNGFWVADASATGNDVTVALLTAPAVWDVKHIGVSGVPGVDLAVSTASPFISYEPTPTAEGHDSGPYVITAGDVYFHHDSVGVRMFAGGPAVRCVVGVDYSVSNVDYVEVAPGASTGGTASGDLVVIAGSSEFRVPFSMSMSATYNGVTANWDAVQTTTISGAGYVRTDVVSKPSLRDAIKASTGLWWPGHACKTTLKVWRRTNNVFEIELAGVPADFSPAMAADEFYSVALVLPDRIIPTGQRVKKSDEERYFSYHPITTELAQSDSPRCYL